MTTSVKATWLQEKESQVFNFSVIVSGLPCVCVCVCVCVCMAWAVRDDKIRIRGSLSND